VLEIPDRESRRTGATDILLAVTAVVVNFNGGAGLIRSLKSLRDQEGIRLRIVVYDDGSADGSPQAAATSGLVDETFVSDTNTQYANRWRAAGLEAARTDLVLVTDNDVDYLPGCLRTLAATFEADPTIAAVTPFIQNRHDGRVFPFSYGNKLHYLGLTTRLSGDGPRIRDSIGTGITMYSKNRLGPVGGYDTALPMGWGSDVELHHRIQLAGLRSVVNLDAVLEHEFKPFGKTRGYRIRGHTHNRLRIFLTHYSAATIVYLLPLLALLEAAQFVYFTLDRLGRPYREGWRLLLVNRHELAGRRRFIQSLRKRPDRELLSAEDIYLPPHFAERMPIMRALVGAANAVLRLYWRIYVAGSRFLDRSRMR
jgi:GT2 family glycosyltransferase